MGQGGWGRWSGMATPEKGKEASIAGAERSVGVGGVGGVRPGPWGLF